MVSSSSSSTPAAGGGARETTTTTSEVNVKEVSGSHVLTINGFTFAGHSWSIKYLPNGGSGLTAATAAASEWVSVYLACTHDVMARFAICFLDEAGKAICSMSTGEEGFPRFTRKDGLERRGYVRNDRLRIRCDITVLQVIIQHHDDEDAADAAAMAKKLVDVPPPDLLRGLGHLLSTGDGADVVFEVGGEAFSAHRCILAARSPVFRAELLGPMAESAASARVGIDDMEARFPVDADDEGEAMAMAQHLLVAADRYGLERLKLICEDKLCGYIDTSTAGTILALAEQHGCHGLKNACSDFLMTGNNLTAAIVTGGFEHLMNSCSSVLQELL
ncbi:hypothetical protein PVAP13_8KG382606, partial [Panicum virgatum]